MCDEILELSFDGFLELGKSDQVPLFSVLVPNPLGKIPILSSHLRLGLPKSLVPVETFKALLFSSILETLPADLTLLDLIP